MQTGLARPYFSHREGPAGCSGRTYINVVKESLVGHCTCIGEGPESAASEKEPLIRLLRFAWKTSRPSTSAFAVWKWCRASWLASPDRRFLACRRDRTCQEPGQKQFLKIKINGKPEVISASRIQHVRSISQTLH